MKVVSLFSGIGGFEKGLLQADPTTEIVFASEIDKYARQIYKKNYGVEPHGDITTIEANDIPDHELMCCGFPCQAFSIAGKRRGFEDTRGTLFFEIMRIVETKRPKLLFLENVRGLLSHDEGRTFQTILRSMDDMGYDAEWQVFNSKNHGVPQHRERVFIIGHLRGCGSRPIFPITNDDNQIDEVQGQNTNCLTARYEGAQATGTYIVENKQYAQALTEARTDEAKEIRKKTKDRDFSPRRGKELVPRKDGLANCVTSCSSSESFIKIGTDSKIRRLTPLECERLQGFPDNWTDGISDSQRYKCIGNAVTVNVIFLL